MPLYRHYKDTLLHIHIPKTGGTSVKKAVEYYGGLVSFISKKPTPQCGHVPPQHMDIDHTKFFFDLGKVPAFAMVRDPWHRTVSEFVWTTSTFHWKIINSWLEQKFLALDHKRYFNHFLPQHKFINKDVSLFKYESDWNKLIKYIETHLHMINFDINFREQSRHKYTPPLIKDCLNNEIRKEWEKLYKEDLDLHQSL